jgi:hypothetical protein
VNLLLTSSTIPEFTSEVLDLWNRFFIADFMPAPDLASYLKFAPAAAAASIDAIVFLQPERALGFSFLRQPREIAPWMAAAMNCLVAQEIRSLPENCAMRDGRKWKRIPITVLTDGGYRDPAYAGVDVDFVLDLTESILHSGLQSSTTWRLVEEAVHRYQRKILGEYEQVGFMVTVDHGRYRVKKAYSKKNNRESEFYFSDKDKSRFRGYVTFGRESEGIEYEAKLFEAVLNDPDTGEREIHNFLEHHPDLLAEAMMGVPISHQPRFPSNNQIPDYLISPILPRSNGETMKLLELKGPEARILDHGRRLHRALSHDVIRAIAQVNDYYESIHDPLNLTSVEKALGYVPTRSERAVLIGRSPSPQDAELWQKRKGEQSLVNIVTYDELLEEHHARHSWRR